MMDSCRFSPYEIYSAPPSLYGNTEGRTVTQILPTIPYHTSQTTQPTRGTSETTADAEHNQTITEENESPVSSFYCSHVPRVIDCLFDVRRPGPGAPAGKGWPVPTASGARRTSAS